MSRSSRKLALGAAVSVAIVVATIALFYTRIGRPLFAMVGGCPLGKAALAVVEKQKVEIVAFQRGDADAFAWSAFGFELDRATIGDVRAWARRSGVACAERREETLVLCKDVFAAAIGCAGDGVSYVEVSFVFCAKDKTLLDVSTLQSRLSLEEASARTREVTGFLEKAFGVPTTRNGDTIAAYFAESAYQTFAMNYRFRDYFVDVTTMILPAGVAIREQYLSARAD